MDKNLSETIEPYEFDVHVYIEAENSMHNQEIVIPEGEYSAEELSQNLNEQVPHDRCTRFYVEEKTIKAKTFDEDDLVVIARKIPTF